MCKMSRERVSGVGGEKLRGMVFGDIVIVPFAVFIYIYFVYKSHKIINTYMRNIAIKSGYKLSEYGLHDKKNNPIQLLSEEAIFDFLQLPYLSPEKR